MSSRRPQQYRVDRDNAPSLNAWKRSLRQQENEDQGSNVILDCGWGRLIFGHTFRDNSALAASLRRERKDHRDIAIYIGDPHVVLALAPHELFLDPSHTYRLYLEQYRSVTAGAMGYQVRKLQTIADAEGVNEIYARRQMVTLDPSFIFSGRASRSLVYLVAEDVATGRIIGAVTGADHVEAFGDPEGGSSLWALAVDPQTTHPGVGQALVVHLIEHFLVRGRSFIDLSVMHDNTQAIGLYEKLGFVRVPVFCVKNKNSFNEPLFAGHPPREQVNPYAAIIIREARRRGVAVEILDTEQAYFALSFGGRTITCRESLSELTTAIAMSRCDDKRVTRRVLAAAGVRTPDQVEAAEPAANEAFLNKHQTVVVKPARGEQGAGVSVGIGTVQELERAIQRARLRCKTVLIEEAVVGQDLRVVVIDYRVVAAAIRKAPRVVGTGEHTVSELIAKQSRRRSAATSGESAIPIDDETERCVREAGYSLSDVPDANVTVVVRKAANLHTGGTIHDVTDQLHARIIEVCKRAAEVLDIPVVGLDLMVPSAVGDEYWVIEANERPGLANHEPQPTAERFIDLLFPQTVS